MAPFGSDCWPPDMCAMLLESHHLAVTEKRRGRDSPLPRLPLNPLAVLSGAWSFLSPVSSQMNVLLSLAAQLPRPRVLALPLSPCGTAHNPPTGVEVQSAFAGSRGSSVFSYGSSALRCPWCAYIVSKYQVKTQSAAFDAPVYSNRSETIDAIPKVAELENSAISAPALSLRPDASTGWHAVPQSSVRA